MTKSAGRPPLSETDIQEFRARVATHAMSIYREDGFDAVSMRRLSKAVGCAPTTLYAHFAGKTEILMLLWAEVLSDMEEHVRACLKGRTEPADRLREAALAFVTYWVDHPEHFRLVFMSNNVGRSEVDSFIESGNIENGFEIFRNLIRDLDPGCEDTNVKSETLVAGMIGLAMCLNTISNYPWPTLSQMTRQLLSGTIS